ncbi:hypothetical protein FIBSPDRAFT_865877 [Athelia psychrophila]|uniref:Uncharacterized protein n=1 Tax=Athelia psychrophila TaxID=1759441 RepID=A0A166F8V7_9AGAM|nr:hypothetical protein FIBSPDRAFT_865877 [Fibularhizoctonia sp. CBS 109695]
MRKPMLASQIIFWLTTRMQHASISYAAFKDNNFHREIDAKFEEYDFDLDELAIRHSSLSTPLSEIFRFGHENIHMVRSFLAMIAGHPRGFVKMLRYGASDGW